MEKKSLDDLKNICFKKNWSDLPIYARMVTFRFSIRIVQLIYLTGITPNRVTAISLVVGVLAWCMFICGNVFTFVLGALLMELYYVMDCVDGQLARLKNVSSKEGAFFDYLLNYIVHPGLFVSMGYGCASSTGNMVFFAAGIISAWGIILGYALTGCKHTVILNSFLKNPKASDKTVQGTESENDTEDSFPKRLFMLMHKAATFPTIMNITTATALICLVKRDMSAAYIVIIFFALNIPCVFVVRLIHEMKAKMVEEKYLEYLKDFETISADKENFDA